jgi:ferritin-like metal-binding protein YciE
LKALENKPPDRGLLLLSPASYSIVLHHADGLCAQTHYPCCVLELQPGGINMTLPDGGYVKALSDLYYSEGALVDALGEMAKAATNPNLAMAFNDHMEETRTQQQRLQEVLSRLNEGALPAQPETPALQSLIEGARTAMDYPEPTPEKDHMLLGVARRVEQQEIVMYQHAIEMAEHAGDATTIEALHASLHEEINTDARMAHLERDLMPKHPGLQAVESM